jgi:hypothetical protein
MAVVDLEEVAAHLYDTRPLLGARPSRGKAVAWLASPPPLAALRLLGPACGAGRHPSSPVLLSESSVGQRGMRYLCANNLAPCACSTKLYRCSSNLAVATAKRELAPKRRTWLPLAGPNQARGLPHLGRRKIPGGSTRAICIASSTSRKEEQVKDPRKLWGLLNTHVVAHARVFEQNREQGNR